jgi:uncharacterized protein YeaO (DUF488 family)
VPENVTVAGLTGGDVPGATRILVDAEHAEGVDLWLPQLAPSRDLLAWFSGNLLRWEEFRQRYQYELDGNPNVRRITEAAQRGPVVLVTRFEPIERSPAQVLRGLLRGR